MIIRAEHNENEQALTWLIIRLRNIAALLEKAERPILPEYLIEQEKLLGEFWTNARDEARRVFAEHTHGPKPFCVTPNGRYDGHGSYVKVKPVSYSPTAFSVPPLNEVRCAFCDRLVSATPTNPEPKEDDPSPSNSRRKKNTHSRDQ